MVGRKKSAGRDGADMPSLCSAQERRAERAAGIGIPRSRNQTLEPRTRPLARCPECDAPSEAICTIKLHDESGSGTLSIDARRTPHLARFFIVGWYTGSRRDVIAGLKWSMVNLETGTMQRREHGAVETKKKAPRVRMGDRLMSHLRRWKRLDPRGTDYIINWRGKRIARPCSSWDRVRHEAELPEYITPHVLRHSRATTMLKANVPAWEVANALGMSLQVLISTYGHHHPDWQKGAANAR